MGSHLKVGKWIEKDSRRIQRCPTYYAADYEVLETVPGEYELRVVFEGAWPCPEWVVCNINSNRVAGATFSGFCGNNFASRDLPLEPVQYVLHDYSYRIRNYAADGNVVLDDRFLWLLSENYRTHPDRIKSWDEFAKFKFCVPSR